MIKKIIKIIIAIIGLTILAYMFDGSRLMPIAHTTDAVITKCEPIRVKFYAHYYYIEYVDKNGVKYQGSATSACPTTQKVTIRVNRSYLVGTVPHIEIIQ